MKGILVALGMLALASSLGAWYWNNGGNPGTAFRTAALERGNLLATISATGTIEPEEVIDIGAQVVGQIKHFGRDPRDRSKWIDYGSVVDEGTVLAHVSRHSRRSCPNPVPSIDCAAPALQSACAHRLA